MYLLWPVDVTDACHVLTANVARDRARAGRGGGRWDKPGGQGKLEGRKLNGYTKLCHVPAQ